MGVTGLVFELYVLKVKIKDFFFTVYTVAQYGL